MCKRSVCLALAALTLGGCATEITWRRRAGLDYFVGKDVPALTASLGRPTRQWRASDAEYLAYDYHGKLWMPGEPGVRTPDTEVAFGPWIDNRTCTTSFKIEVGRVAAWSIDGDGCRAVPFPSVRRFAAERMDEAAASSVGTVTPFGDDKFTGRSVVETGTFYSR
jgi:hypothetical protein